MTYGYYGGSSWWNSRWGGRWGGGSRGGRGSRWNNGGRNNSRRWFQNSWSWNCWAKDWNYAPDAKSDFATVSEDDGRTTVFNVLANDSDANGDSIEVVSFNNGQGEFGVWFDAENGGEWCLLEDGCVDFRPKEDGEFDYLKEGEVLYNTFTYTISDGKGGYDTATATVKIVGKNDGPEFLNIPNDDKLFIDENTTYVATILASDVEGEKVTYSLENTIDSAFLQIDPDTGVLSFKDAPDFETPLDTTPGHPNPAFDGKYGVTIVATDESGASVKRTVWVIVNDVDEAPTALDDTATSDGSAVTVDVLANDVDEDGDAISIKSVTAAANGQVDIVDGKLVYTPDAGFTGTETFEYTVTDQGGLTSTAQVSIDVNGGQEPPVLGDGTYTLGNHPITGKIKDNVAGGQEFGLRLDGLLSGDSGSGNNTVFDFEHPDSAMYITIDGDSIRIFGVTYGGRVDENGFDESTTGLFEVDFTYNNTEFRGGDDDFFVDDSAEGTNSGYIKQLTGAQAGMVTDLSDMAGEYPYTFQLGDGDDDTGLDGHDGVSGRGWLFQDGQVMKASDFLFTVKEPVEPVCAKLVGDTELNEGETGSYKIQLDGVSAVDQYFTLEVTNQSAQRIDQWVPNQDFMHKDMYDVRYGRGGRLAYEVFGRVPNGTRLSDGDRAAFGTGDADWDYTVTQNNQVQTSTITVMVPAGQTMSDSFEVQTWLEQVTVDLDSPNNFGYMEGTETFSISVTNADTEVCLDHLEVSIHDRTDYKFVSPISIDLDGNGIQTLSIDQGVTFDILNTGNAINTGWLSSGDGFLAVDDNGNGQIDSRAELFGGGVGDGFAKLATFDSNGDGWVDAADAKFAALSIWQDANSNGVTDKGELMSLDAAGISSLKVAHDASNFSMDAQGNILGERSLAMTTGGKAVDMIDVYFEV